MLENNLNEKKSLLAPNINYYLFLFSIEIVLYVRTEADLGMKGVSVLKG